MAEVTSDAYIALRTYITSNWKTVSLRNDAGAEIKKLTLDGTKVAWTHTKATRKVKTGTDGMGRPVYSTVPYESSQELELTITLTGADFTIPATISKSVLLDSNSIVMSSEDFQAFTFQNAADQLVIKHKIQVPVIG